MSTTREIPITLVLGAVGAAALAWVLLTSAGARETFLPVSQLSGDGSRIMC